MSPRVIGPLKGASVVRSVCASVLSTHQNSPGQSLGRYHDAGPVFDRRHPAHLAGRSLRLLVSAGLGCPISLNVPWVGHFLLKQTVDTGMSKYASHNNATTVQNTHFNGAK